MAEGLAAQPRDEIVSSDAESLILVNEQDEEVGFMSKALCHDGAGVLHRAFSLFVFNRRGELLLQQRAAGKRLWPLFWSNSCCSHPRRGETMDEAVNRRLFQEVRIRSELSFLYKFQYHALFGDAGAEHELCWVYAGVSDDVVRVNRTEIAAWRFVAPDALDAEMAATPDAFTPWFKLEWQRLREQHGAELKRLIASAA
ncbi:MAG: isopentenyl-diphosphate Delta-isomerase [Pseudomonadota bacterium]